MAFYNHTNKHIHTHTPHNTHTHKPCNTHLFKDVANDLCGETLMLLDHMLEDLKPARQARQASKPITHFIRKAHVCIHVCHVLPNTTPHPAPQPSPHIVRDDASLSRLSASRITERISGAPLPCNTATTLAASVAPIIVPKSATSAAVQPSSFRFCTRVCTRSSISRFNICRYLGCMGPCARSSCHPP